MPNETPAAARAAVMQRDHSCVRCGAVRSATHVHHRRSRSVPGQHQHCPCNLIRLCPTCHEFVHRSVAVSKSFGFIVSRFVEEPYMVPLRSGDVWWMFTCSAWYRKLNEDNVEMTTVGTPQVIKG